MDRLYQRIDDLEKLKIAACCRDATRTKFSLPPA